MNSALHHCERVSRHGAAANSPRNELGNGGRRSGSWGDSSSLGEAIVRTVRGFSKDLPVVNRRTSADSMMHQFGEGLASDPVMRTHTDQLARPQRDDLRRSVGHTSHGGQVGSQFPSLNDQHEHRRLRLSVPIQSNFCFRERADRAGRAVLEEQHRVPGQSCVAFLDGLQHRNVSCPGE